MHLSKQVYDVLVVVAHTWLADSLHCVQSIFQKPQNYSIACVHIVTLSNTHCWWVFNLNSSSKHELCSQEAGDYKICFDNKFSYLSSKVVYFEILNVNEDEDYDDLAGIFDDEEKEEEYYDVQVSDIEASFKFSFS